MKRFFILFVVFCLVIPLFGCLESQPQVIPPGCEHSLIMRKIPDYRHVDILLQLANLEALKRHVYTKEQALDALKDIEAVLKDQSSTYAQLLSVVISKIRWVNEHAGSEIFILTQYFQVFNSDRVIDPCDRDLLLKHLSKQKTVILMVK